MIYWTKISGNPSTESNGTEIFEKFVSNFGQTLGPSPTPDCRMVDGGVKSLFITVASVFSSDDLPFFLWHLYTDVKRNVALPDAPMGKLKTIRND